LHSRHRFNFYLAPQTASNRNEGRRVAVTPYKQAIDAWIETGDYKGAADPATLHAPESYRIYLENRLRTAFAAGWSARAEVAASSQGEAPEHG
jgi:hypothetical protein